MGKREEPLVLKPPFFPKGFPLSEEVYEGERKKVLAMKKASAFFTKIYDLVARKENGGAEGHLKFFNGNYQRSFRPDVVSDNKNNRRYSEVKIATRKNCQFLISPSQIENYICHSLEDASEGMRVNTDFAFYLYGGWHEVFEFKNLNDSELMRKLSTTYKELTILPLNLLLFALAYSNFRELNQTTSQSPRDFPNSFIFPGGLISKLNKKEDFLQELMENYPPSASKLSARYVRDISDLNLNDLSVRREESLPITFNYHGRKYRIEPFSITRYSLSSRDYVSWFRHFQENHGRILEELGLEDICHDDIPF